MINDINKLAQILQIKLEDPQNAYADFPMQVPKSFVKRIKPQDINDPLLLQILPQVHELSEHPDFITDPLTEKQQSPIPGLIHKYKDRVLLLVTDTCAINCRFCFRRHLHPKISDWPKILEYINNHSTISEVILSGGDPLMLTPSELAKIINNLTQISHLERIRIHSRVPIVLPERINPKLFQTSLPIILVVHCNHPNEIDAATAKVLQKLKLEGITVFNQSVLLRNINDDTDTLVALSEKLFKNGVIPYYLHILDKVKGATHFYVNKHQAKEIHRKMQAKLPGYLVPKLVVEIKNKKIYV